LDRLADAVGFFLVNRVSRPDHTLQRESFVGEDQTMPTRTFQPIEALPLPDEALRSWAEIPTTIASDISGGRLLIDAAIRPLRPLGSA
jgi:hypothetical protein